MTEPETDETSNQAGETQETEEELNEQLETGSDNEPKTLEEAKARIAQLESRKSKLNRESAARRVETKQLREQLAALENEVKALRTESQQTSQRRVFQAAVAKGKVVFAGEAAEADALEHAAKLLSDSVSMEEALKQVLETRPYLRKTVDTVDLNDTERGKTTDLGLDEKALAASFGIPYIPPEGGK